MCIQNSIIMNNSVKAKSPQKKFMKNSYNQLSVEWSAADGAELSPNKEYTKPVDVKLHTRDRALKRAMFNNLVANKLYQLQQKKIEEEQQRKMMEEKAIKLLRKEMVPKAQLMPLFDRPFFPQRSNRPITIPKEPSFYANIEGKYCKSNHTFQPYHTMKPIK